MTGPGFQGIDPLRLAQLMGLLKNGASNGQQAAGCYLAQFRRYGLDTTAVSKLLADYSWAQSQQAMLQRRFIMASSQPSGQFKNAMATAGAGSLQSPAKAKRSGSAEGRKLQQLIDDAKWDGDWAPVWARLSVLGKEDGDPDYMAAMFQALGPLALCYLGYAYHREEQLGNSKQADELQDVIGHGLAAASYQFPLTQRYMDGVVIDAQGFDLYALAPFLAVGTYSPLWLDTLLQYVTVTGLKDPVTYAVFGAIANNPAYARSFIRSLTPSEFSEMAYGYGDGLTEAAFLQVCATAMKQMSPSQSVQFMNQIYNVYTAMTPDNMNVVMPALGNLLGTFYSVAPPPPKFSSPGRPGQSLDNWSQLISQLKSQGAKVAMFAWGFSQWIYSAELSAESTDVFERQLAEGVVISIGLALAALPVPGLDAVGATITVAGVESLAGSVATAAADKGLFGSPPDPQGAELRFYEKQAAYAQIQSAGQLLAQGRLVYTETVPPYKPKPVTLVFAQEIRNSDSGKSKPSILQWVLQNQRQIEIQGTGGTLESALDAITAQYFRAEAPESS